jgi:diguanylate cyclase (GGDEF)-like protein
VFYIDLNEFKTINDCFGHDTGDQVLVSVGKVLKASFRDEDLISRIGGDEFLVAVTGKFSSEDLQVMLKKVNDNLRKHPFSGIDDREITASIGISMCTDGKMTKSELLKKADIAMYQNKHENKPNFNEP